MSRRVSKPPIFGQWVCDVYGPAVMFVAGCSFEELSELLKKKFELDLDLGVEGQIPAAGYTITAQVNGTGEVLHVVWIEEPGDLGTLVHESIHLGIVVLAGHEVDFVAGNSEALTYYVQSWFSKFLGCVMKAKERKMPKGSKVDRCYQKLKGKKGKSSAARICQKSTGLSLKTGKKPKRKKK